MDVSLQECLKQVLIRNKVIFANNFLIHIFLFFLNNLNFNIILLKLYYFIGFKRSIESINKKFR